jgi:nucleoid-associated protein YgaU
MGFFDFTRNAGKKLPESNTAPTGDTPGPSRAGDSIEAYVRAHNVDADGLAIDFDVARATATVRGTAKDQATREMIVLLTGNIHGVEKVDDQMAVAGGAAASAATFYTVRSGDTLSKIARQHYGDANRYPDIFEANRPMLKDPDTIFPGQVLRIPREGAQAAA